MASAMEDPQQRIEEYLVKLRMLLRGMNDDDVHEIVLELRAPSQTRRLRAERSQRPKWTVRSLR
jgi:hypothetical protein